MNEAPNVQSLEGNVLLKDHVHWALYGSTAWKCALLVSALMCLFLFATNFLERKAIDFNLFLEVVFPSLVVFAMIIIWTLILIIMGFRRLTPNQRIVKWTFSEADVVVQDGAGNLIKKPWSEVSSIKFNRLGVRVCVKPVGSFWIPNRWLPNDLLIELKALTENFGPR